METTLYSGNGQPIAYIVDDGENSIYLWEGRAFAYIADGNLVYGWNGKHLGFFVNGILYDLKGKRVGFVHETCPSVVHVEPVKHVKSVKSVKSVRHVAYVRPALSMSHSDLDLRSFLKQG